jgi:hypothetical protein
VILGSRLLPVRLVVIAPALVAALDQWRRSLLEMLFGRLRQLDWQQQPTALSLMRCAEDLEIL